MMVAQQPQECPDRSLMTTQEVEWRLQRTAWLMRGAGLASMLAALRARQTERASTPTQRTPWAASAATRTKCPHRLRLNRVITGLGSTVDLRPVRGTNGC